MAPLTAAPLELATATIPQLQAAMAKGSLTSQQLVERSLARVTAYDDAGPHLNAMILVNPKALDEAKALYEWNYRKQLLRR